MRISIVSRIYSPEPSAASAALEELAREFNERGHEVTVLTTKPTAGAIYSDPPGVRVRRAPVLRDRSGYVRGYLQYLSFDLPLCVRLLFQRRADLYLVEPPPTTGAIVRVATALLRRPYIYDVADIWSDAAVTATSSKVVLFLLRCVEKFAIRGATHAVTISSGVASRLKELGINTPVAVTGFGADTRVFAYPKSLDPVESPYFIYAGTYSDLHGAEVFIDAFARFAEHRPGCRLLFVGNGTERANLERRVRELGVNGVEFHSPVSAARLSPMLSSAIASLASLKPGVGYDYAFTSKAYSSLAAGSPVIFTGPGPTAGFLENANQSQRSGAAVPYEIGAIYRALLDFADNPLSTTERQELSNWTQARHSLHAVASKIVDIAEATYANRAGTR